MWNSVEIENTVMTHVPTARFGWLKEHHDFRDYTVETPVVKSILDQSTPLKAASTSIPEKVDLREWCSPVEEQGIQDCTANAGANLMEYYQKRAFGTYLNMSRLFIYKLSRRLAGIKGDSGSYLRSTMQALALFGAPPEKYLPYNVDRFEEEPEAFHYAMADNFEAVKYYRLDTPGLDRKVLLDNLKKNLAAGLPFVLGFTVYSSLSNDGWVPFPKKGDSFQGGHAIMVCGYDNKMGALLFKNSWGLGWGHKGYGWIPDSYILQGLADDVWSLVQADFVNTDLFK